MKLSTILVVVLTLTAQCAFAVKKLPLAYLSFDGIHVGKSGEIFAADGFDGTKVYAISRDGTTYDLADGLLGPIDIAEDSQGNLYVTNLYGNKVSKITRAGVVSDFAETLEGPAGITVDRHDNLYVSHFGSDAGDGDVVLKITPDATVTIFSQGGLLNAPVGIASDADGNVYTANFNNGKILKISADGSQYLLAQIPSEVGFAIGHLEHVNGRIFATGLVDQKIYIIRQNGRIRGRDIVPEGEFPNGIAFDPVGHQILFINTFAPASSIKRIPLSQKKSHAKAQN